MNSEDRSRLERALANFEAAQECAEAAVKLMAAGTNDLRTLSAAAAPSAMRVLRAVSATRVHAFECRINADIVRVCEAMRTLIDEVSR